MEKNIKVLAKTRAYNGHFKIDRYELEQEADGRKFKLVRENFERGNAAAVLLYDPNIDGVLVVEEFRIGYLAAGFPAADCFNMGPIAGVIDAGEDPIDTVIREAVEEAGVVVDRAHVSPGFTTLPSPGGTSEQVTMFVAIADLSSVESGKSFGVDSEAEQTWRHIVDRSETMAMAMTQPTSGHLTALLLQLEIMLLKGLVPDLKPKQEIEP